MDTHNQGRLLSSVKHETILDCSALMPLLDLCERQYTFLIVLLLKKKKTISSVLCDDLIELLNLHDLLKFQSKVTIAIQRDVKKEQVI